MHTEMLIGSRFVKGTEHEEKIFNPRTGEVILSLPEASTEQVEAAVESADKAFAKWSRTTPGERAGYLLRLADRFAAEEQEFADLEALNCGKPRHTVLRDETPAVIDVLRFFAGAARVMPASAAGEYLPGYTSMVRRDPIGVVASIAPWNYPLVMAAWKIGPALAAGNTVVLKPSEQTPLSTLKLAKIASEVLPEGVLNVVVGRGESVGNALINHPKVAMISLTGDIATGKKVLAAATRTIKRTHLELGGKAPVIVFDDADIASVVEGVRVFGYANAGQDCTAACRIYAGAKVYDKLVADLSSAVSTIAFGRDDDAQNEIGPLISERQRERVASFVERASEVKHISVATGGKRAPGPGFYYTPTVVAGALQEERSCAARCSVRSSR
jgi:aminobutyraldehyde dehydrogenase